MPQTPTPSLPPFLAHLLAFIVKLLTPPVLPPPPLSRPPSRRADSRAAPRSAILPFIADDELHWFSDIPLAADRRPVYRSQTAVHIGGLANEQAALIRPFSLDDEENLTHRVARYRRAGLLQLAAEDVRQLEEIHRLGLPPSRLRRHCSQPAAGDPDQLQRMYGSAAEDRLRLLRYHQRCEDLEATRFARLPARAPYDLQP
jgi:hypothetical protein